MSEFAPGYHPDDLTREPTAERPRLVVVGRAKQKAGPASSERVLQSGKVPENRTAAEIAARIQEHNAFLDNELTPIPEWEQAEIDARQHAAIGQATSHGAAAAVDPSLSSQGFLGSVEGDIRETKE